MASESEAMLVTDYISAVCSAIAAVIALVTVITVIVAVRQLLTEHRAFSSGLSREALGDWHENVRSRRLLGLQQEIHTPTISVPLLLQANWKSEFVFPGVPVSTAGDVKTEPEKGLIKASWVNFISALGIQPGHRQLYQMSAQPDLANGIVPMRWEGKTLVAICSLLGFQSYEQKPNFREPMKLPMQWLGPLGWLQFREGLNGCVVEFRSRARIDDQIDKDIHSFFEKSEHRGGNNIFVGRLWRSINGMAMGDEKALYLGGTDDQAEMRAKRLGAGGNSEQPEPANRLPGFDHLMNGEYGIPGEKSDLSTASTAAGTPGNLHAPPIPDAGLKKREDDDLFEDFMKAPSKEYIAKTLRNADTPRGKRKSDLEDELDSELGGLQDMLRRMHEKRLGKMEVFVRCQGLLSTVFQGEFANSRGLSIKDCEEYSRAYMDYEEINQEKTPHRMGDLFMDETLLGHMRKAMSFIKPDGYYFTPTRSLASDLAEVYRHVKRVCDDLKNDEAVFPKLKSEDDWPKTCQSREYLHYAMVLCNNLQYIRQHRRAHFTIGDMGLMRKASEYLPKEADLVWAMLISPELFRDLERAFNRTAEKYKATGGWDFLEVDVRCSKSVLDCTDLMKSCGVSRDEDVKYATASSTPPTAADPMNYRVPLCSDSTYKGYQLLGSFLDVMITYYWIEKRWITDVEYYDHVIPQTITMC
ncbi:hypothetical protein QBC41DRAFT_394130 [Cercophora samala]|uniref:Uncharacterized protein n=1 Tax=Cercophora samala TaxID=330535 RepID=A0AA40DE74_9PEZI|nr:hypothetical protein QBC41DRAFT_394130 [Cercophora samala]